MDIGDSAALGEHVEHVDAEAVLPRCHQFLSEVFDKALQLRVMSVVLHRYEKLRDAISLEQHDRLLLGCDLANHFIDDLGLKTSCIVVEVGVFHHRDER